VLRFQDAVDPLVYNWGAGLLVLWLAGLLSSGLRRRGWLAAGALYLALLLPALPLAHHTYRYYLYAPLAGFAWCVAAACDLLFERLWPAPRRTQSTRRSLPATAVAGHADTNPRALGLTLVVVALLTVNAGMLVHKVETMPFSVEPTLRADAVVDRALIAERAIADLRKSTLPAGTRLLLWSPIGRSLAGDTGESYFEQNARTALFDGLAIRIFFPGVDSVRFVSAYRSMPEPYRYAVYRPDGTLRVASSTELDSIVAGSAPTR